VVSLETPAQDSSVQESRSASNLKLVNLIHTNAVTVIFLFLREFWLSGIQGDVKLF
jgi:hypothetical protein